MFKHFFCGEIQSEKLFTKNSSRIKYFARITSGSSPGSTSASPIIRKLTDLLFLDESI